MFEDSTFESTGRIRTRSRGWMLATLALNSSILLALILVPLIYPEALPRQVMAFLMEAPTPPLTPPPVPLHQPVRAVPVTSEMPQGVLVMPRQIPNSIVTPSVPEPQIFTSVATMEPANAIPGGIGTAFRPQPPPKVVSDTKTTVRLPSALAAGLLLYKPFPRYPELAKAMHAEGTVILSATISKDGTIANLRVVSGPSVLQQAALDAVSQWRYRPYLLNGQPVDVETSVNVIFTLGR